MVMDMEDTILNTLDDVGIASTRSSLACRERALSSLERLLASICVSPNNTQQLHVFLDLQSSFETNVASRLVSSLASWTPVLHNALSTASDDVPLDTESACALCRPMMQALAILQGVSLLHGPSKRFLARRWCIQLLIDLLLLSRHVPSAVTEVSMPSTPTKSSHLSSTASKAASSSPSPTLSSAIIDTLLCILVDSPEGLRLFEEVGGLDAVVRTLKRAGVLKETKIKCLEFLYFYLLPEEELILSGTQSYPQKPTSIGSDLQISQYTAFNTLSGVTMIDHGNTPLPSPVSMITITPASSGESMSSSTSSDGRQFAPNPKIHELRLLTKELDFTPSTPVKKRQQVAALGVGTPCTPNRKTNGAVSDHKYQSMFNSNLAARNVGASSDVEPKTPSRRQERHAAKGSTHINKDLARDPSPGSLMDFGVFATSNPKHQGRSVIFPSESGSSAGGTSSDGSAGTIDLTWDQPRRAKDVGTPSRRGGRYLHTGSAVAGGTPMRKVKSEVHSPSRHAHSKSEANMLGNGVKSVLMVRSQSVDDIGLMTPVPTNSSSPHGRRVKSTQEKKELLGTCLGNVDALVEGMQKAGIWGLV